MFWHWCSLYSEAPEQGGPVSENRMRKSSWLTWTCRNTKQMGRLKCIWIPLNSLKDNQKHLIKLWSHITFVVVKLCWLCWLDLQMYAILNKRRFWSRRFCSLWLGKIARELLEMKAWGTLYPGCILPTVRLCKGQKNPENYTRYYKRSRCYKSSRPLKTLIFSLSFSPASPINTKGWTGTLLWWFARELPGKPQINY